MRASKGKKSEALAPKCKLWLDCRGVQGVFGDGKWQLLRALQEKGSLADAARSLHISYRKAWGDLQKAEKSMGIRLIERRRGGRGGGRTYLTIEGQKWVAAYSAYRREIEKALNGAYQRHLSKLIG
jgi:molybdate transport system regulatory protein